MIRKVCFDTSVVVAALLRSHPRHGAAFARISQVHRGEVAGVITTHGLAEVFATLTALPLKPKLQPSEAERIVRQSVMERFSVQPLSEEHYRNALALTVRQGLNSGAIYDALHLIGARASDCHELLTFNGRHFQLLAPDDPLVVVM